MADFLKAVEWMKKGKKVRRKIWADKIMYWYLADPKDMHTDIKGYQGAHREDKEVDYFTPDLFQGKDWMIYKEKK
ncbi:unnamed protein product [marine sediment metagenome]|uniref:Thoeris anti-defense 2-like domain-containing protein n=1 Tax=marine sediment metagenome TaxID=412755 RepID=X0W9V0_9ZZZZ